MFDLFLCQKGKVYTMVNRVLSSGQLGHVMLRISHLYIKPSLKIAVFCILLGTLVNVEAQEPKSALTVENVNALIPAIEAAEEGPFFLNLKVESETWVETKANLSDPCELWKRTPIYVSCTAWLDGRPRGKARVDVNKEVLEWRDGAAPYAESSYSVGFDGQYGRIVHHTRGHSGKQFRMKEGKLLADSPKQLRDNYLGSCTGARFSFQFFFSDEDKDMGRTFSRLFRASISPAALEAKAFEVALEEFGGVECIKFGSGEQNWGARISYWLDPARGFALLGHDNISIREDGSERVSTRIRVTKLKEVAEGVWWPVEVSSVSRPSMPGKPWRRFVYRASNVVANDPNFDESVFTVPFPDGYLIDDKVNGRKYKVGQQ